MITYSQTGSGSILGPNAVAIHLALFPPQYMVRCGTTPRHSDFKPRAENGSEEYVVARVDSRSRAHPWLTPNAIETPDAAGRMIGSNSESRNGPVEN